MAKNVSIIGGGPTGCATGYLLAKSGMDVNIYEEHSKIGKPIQCTGLVTNSFTNLVDMKKKFIVNKINKARIFSPNQKYIEVNMQKPDIILDRSSFDVHMADKAKSAGAKIKLRSKFKKINSKNIIIGADGPNSTVARSAGIFGKREFLSGIQAVVKLKNDNAIEFFPFIGTFGWVVPENESMVRIGLLGRENTVKDFNYLLKMKNVGKIIEKQGGVVPIYNNRLKTQYNNIYLVGDAATQVKATTGGGLVPGLRCAKVLAESIIENKNYEKEWKKEVGSGLWMHLKARRVMDKFSNKDWNDIIDIFNSAKNKDVLGEVGRDNPAKLFLRLGLQEPRLWKYLFKF